MIPHILNDASVVKKGFLEAKLEDQIQKLICVFSSFKVYNNLALNSIKERKTFFPDLALIDEKQNIYIDIEIDEPYDLLTRVPTHTLESDANRNIFFNENGWIVIRFSEFQVHQNILGCCAVIANTLKKINKAFVVPPNLSSKHLDKQSFWTKVKSKELSDNYFRESYLGISFEDKNGSKKVFNPTKIIFEKTPHELGKTVHSNVDFPKITQGQLPKIPSSITTSQKDNITLKPSYKLSPSDINSTIKDLPTEKSKSQNIVNNQPQKEKPNAFIIGVVIWIILFFIFQAIKYFAQLYPAIALGIILLVMTIITLKSNKKH